MYTKKIDTKDLVVMKEHACHLKMHTLCNIFNFLLYVLVSLIKDLEYVSKVHYRWMYYIEKYIK